MEIQMIKCLECGVEFSKRIQWTHLKQHDLSINEYKNKYPGSNLVSEQGLLDGTISLSQMIKKYGLEDGTKRFNEYRAKQSRKNTFEHKKTKYGWDAEKFVNFNKSRAITVENLKKKYGEELGIQKYNEYCVKQKRNGNELSYFIEKYGDEAGLRKYNEVCKKKARTLENYQIQYGEELGKIKYEEYRHKHAISLNNKFRSILQDAIIRNLSETLFKHNIQFMSGEFSKEFATYDKTNNACFQYDFVILHPKKLCIEINGTYWHADPLKYKAVDILNFPKGQKILASEIWEKDKKKQDYIKKLGFELLIIWEDEYNLNKDLTIKNIITWIKTKLQLQDLQ
jgi:G:T-mismatch repair DNA endonuclease (very short patch repair protein)